MQVGVACAYEIEKEGCGKQHPAADPQVDLELGGQALGKPGARVSETTAVPAAVLGICRAGDACESPSRQRMAGNSSGNNVSQATADELPHRGGPDRHDSAESLEPEQSANSNALHAQR